jgi:hypothetical protein
MECNGRLKKVVKSEIEHKLEEGTRSSFDTFYQCEECEKIYWAGSHFEKMQDLIKGL